MHVGAENLQPCTNRKKVEESGSFMKFAKMTSNPYPQHNTTKSTKPKLPQKRKNCHIQKQAKK
ncbi:hypothetical protein CJD36_014065 [Flavipsychrobacter stenotrophus]|uniref:Uncharacterized protein n=1 Tax=Flavipsychrobacter stenotrophus TaxID=2077091 RepID=A0A2S7SVZ4_9BACT|nr:hypothetical protein CJD36_014065 [Flavipsychrobacter stenotrophus]